MKIKQLVFLPLLLLILLSCIAKNKDGSDIRNIIEATYNELSTHTQLDSLLNSFLEENSDSSYIYQMYVDNKWHAKPIGGGNLTLVASTSVEKNTPKPICYFSYKSKRIFIYQGIERYLKTDDEWNLNFDEKNKSNKIIWNIIFDDDQKTIQIIKDGFPPYMNEALPPLDDIGITIKDSQERGNLANNENFHFASQHLQIDNRLDSIFSSFLDTVKLEMGDKSNAYLYRLYVNNLACKKDDSTFYLNSLSLSQSYPDSVTMVKNDFTPLFYIKYKGVNIYLYTGLESFFRTDAKKLNLPSLDIDAYTTQGHLCIFQLSDSELRIQNGKHHSLSRGFSDSFNSFFELDWMQANITWKKHKKQWIDLPCFRTSKNTNHN